MLPLPPAGTGQSGMEPERTSIRRSSSSASSSTHQGTTPTPGIATTTAEQQPSTAKKKSRLSNFLSSSSKKKEPEPNKGKKGSTQLLSETEKSVSVNCRERKILVPLL